MDQNMTPTTREELRAKNTKIIHNPATGNTFMIGKISGDDLWEQGILVTRPKPKTDAPKTDDPPLDLETRYPDWPEQDRLRATRLQKAAVIGGLWAGGLGIKIVERAPQGEEMSIYEIDPDDRVFISDEVLIFSKISHRRTEEKADPAKAVPADDEVGIFRPDGDEASKATPGV